MWIARGKVQSIAGFFRMNLSTLTYHPRRPVSMWSTSYAFVLEEDELIALSGNAN